MSRLAVFDIDGTLTDTNAIDRACFVEAMSRLCGIDAVDDDWSSYPHTTDRAIAAEVLRRAWKRPPAEAEIQEFHDGFIALLDQRMTTACEIPGAIAFLERLRREAWNIVLCTGAWRASARMKLARAGFPDGLLIASCDEAEAREDIVKNGIAMMPASSHIVVFGDAIWDVRAARNLGLRFIGVGQRSQAETWIRDYSDADAVFGLIS